MEAQSGESFGYASLRSVDSSNDVTGSVRTSQEVRELLRQHQQAALSYQARNKEQFEDSEAIRKKNLRVTLNAWDQAMAKQKKRVKDSTPSHVSQEATVGSPETVSGPEVAPSVTQEAYELSPVQEPTAAADRRDHIKLLAKEAVEKRRLLLTQKRTEELSRVSVSGNPDTIAAPADVSVSTENTGVVWSAEDLRLHRERFRQKYPYFASSRHRVSE